MHTSPFGLKIAQNISKLYLSPWFLEASLQERLGVRLRHVSERLSGVQQQQGQGCTHPPRAEAAPAALQPVLCQPCRACLPLTIRLTLYLGMRVPAVTTTYGAWFGSPSALPQPPLLALVSVLTLAALPSQLDAGNTPSTLLSPLVPKSQPHEDPNPDMSQG